MNAVFNKFLLDGDKFMPEMNQSSQDFSRPYGTFTKRKQEYKNSKRAR